MQAHVHREVCSFVAALAAIAGWSPLTARGDEGLFLDLTSLTFAYELIDPAAGAGEVIGAMTLSPGASTHLTLHRLDLGGDRAFGGGDDVILDIAEIGDATRFAAILQGQVIRGSTPNEYTIAADMAVTDVVTDLSDPSISGLINADRVALEGPLFRFAGTLSTLAGRDSLLGPAAGSEWIFEGLASDTAPLPDADHVRGRVTLDSGRTFFDEAVVGEFHFAGLGIEDLDAFFLQDRGSLSADVKISMVPEPASLLLLLLGAAAIRRTTV